MLCCNFADNLPSTPRGKSTTSSQAQPRFSQRRKGLTYPPPPSSSNQRKIIQYEDSKQCWCLKYKENSPTHSSGGFFHLLPSRLLRSEASVQHQPPNNCEVALTLCTESILVLWCFGGALLLSLVCWVFFLLLFSTTF